MINEKTIYLLVLSFLAGGLFVHFVGARAGRIRRLAKALQGLGERYADEVKRADAARVEWAGERVVLKGSNELMYKKLESMARALNTKANEIAGLQKALGQYRKLALEVHEKAVKVCEHHQLGENEMYEAAKECMFIARRMREIGG